MITTDETIASEDLNVTGYSGKWRAAKEIAVEGKHDSRHTGLPYWERVRVIFLELGGERIDGRRC